MEALERLFKLREALHEQEAALGAIINWCNQVTTSNKR